jgi:hypothetical protein
VISPRRSSNEYPGFTFAFRLVPQVKRDLTLISFFAVW